MGQFMEFIRARGYRKAFLWTTSELTTAARLYASAGFRLTEEKKSSSFGKAVTERRYDLSLQQK
jgi:peptidyl-dipeptidase Dcp